MDVDVSAKQGEYKVRSGATYGGRYMNCALGKRLDGLNH